MGISRKQIIEQNEISELYTFHLRNIPQKVLVEGRSKDLPIVINLHGGPGTPIPFSVGCRGLFPANKIILFGMSWGSVLALKVLKKVTVDAVVIWGQVFRRLFLNDEVYRALEQAGLSEKKMQRIRAITADNFSDKDLQFLTGNIRKHTDGYTNKKGKQAPLAPIIKGLLTSPDYTFKDFKAIMVNETTTSSRLWKELLRLDLTEELLEISVPYYILQGDTDIVTSTTDIVSVIDASDNPYLHCQVIDNSGHMPGKAGMDAVFETLVNATTWKGEESHAESNARIY